MTDPRESVQFERKAPGEADAIADIVRGILTVQARLAARQKRPLGRGTHTKGICVRGTFEVLDVAARAQDAALAGRLARGLFARPGAYPATVRFANGASQINPDTARDVRAMSFAIDVPTGTPGDVTRLDFSMNDAPTFPINDAHAFATLMKVASADGAFAMPRASGRRVLISGTQGNFPANIRHSSPGSVAATTAAGTGILS